MTFKIINFVEIFNGIRIVKLKTHWIVDEIGQILLNNAEKLVYKK